MFSHIVAGHCNESIIDVVGKNGHVIRVDIGCTAVKQNNTSRTMILTTGDVIPRLLWHL